MSIINFVKLEPDVGGVVSGGAGGASGAVKLCSECGNPVSDVCVDSLNGTPCKPALEDTQELPAVATRPSYAVGRFAEVLVCTVRGDAEVLQKYPPDSFLAHELKAALHLLQHAGERSSLDVPVQQQMHVVRVLGEVKSKLARLMHDLGYRSYTKNPDRGEIALQHGLTRAALAAFSFYNRPASVPAGSLGQLSAGELTQQAAQDVQAIKAGEKMGGENVPQPEREGPYGAADSAVQGSRVGAGVAAHGSEAAV
jgi:hypothetical protein